MAKKICKGQEEEEKKRGKVYRCEKCGAKASKESRLCKPVKR